MKKQVNRALKRDKVKCKRGQSGKAVKRRSSASLRRQ